ncbi:MAG: ANTAR domain-containing protein [Planctomycetota bacterium]
MPRELRLVLAHGSDQLLSTLSESLDKRHSVIATCGTVGGLRSTIMRERPDLVVTGIEFADGDGLEVMIELGKTDPVPSVIVTAKRSIGLVEKAMQDHVMAYLLEPVRPDELEAAIIVAEARFEQLEALNKEVDDLRQALQDRKVIERAKGVVMASEGLSELDAFIKIRSDAQSRRVRMIDVAQELLDTAGN